MSGLPLRLAAVVAMGFLTAGCAIARVQQTEQDTLATWSDRPLPPDPALAATAVTNQSSCAFDENDGPIRMLIQDRRTQLSAAFLVAGRTTFGSCFVTKGGGGTSGGSGPLPEAMTTAITIDEDGEGDVGGGKARMLGGRVVNRASRVVVVLADGRAVVASIGNGYWLAWWPATTLGTRVIAMDATGAEIANLQTVE